MTEEEMLLDMKRKYYATKGNEHLTEGGVNIGEDTINMPINQLEGNDYYMDGGDPYFAEGDKVEPPMPKKQGGFITGRGDAGEPIYGEYTGPAISQGGGLVPKKQTNRMVWNPEEGPINNSLYEQEIEYLRRKHGLSPTVPGRKGGLIEKRKMDGDYYRQWGEDGYKPGGTHTPGKWNIPSAESIFESLKQSDLNKRLYNLRMKLQNKFSNKTTQSNDPEARGGEY